jgi:hypothetical protein
MPPATDVGRLLIVGLPRSGTTLLATLLGAQPRIHFMTDYFPAFAEALHRLGKGWNDELSQSQRRIALALVRDQFLRVRHPVLVKQSAFATIDDLHRLVLAELRSADDAWVGHKLLMSPELLRATLEQTSVRCLLLLRDPRDAALSYFHRTGGGVERYLRTWCDAVRACRELETHPRLLALRFEDLIGAPERTLERVGEWLGIGLDARVPELEFRRSRAHGGTRWEENSAFDDVSGRFARQPIGRWRAHASSPIVRYAAWAARGELTPLGYEAAMLDLSARERVSYASLRALELLESRAHESVSVAGQWLRRRLEPLSAR